MYLIGFASEIKYVSSREEDLYGKVISLQLLISLQIVRMTVFCYGAFDAENRTGHLSGQV